MRPVSLMIFKQKKNSCTDIKCQIITKFCTCTDSIAVSACAEFCVTGFCWGNSKSIFWKFNNLVSWWNGPQCISHMNGTMIIVHLHTTTMGLTHWFLDVFIIQILFSNSFCWLKIFELEFWLFKSTHVRKWLRHFYTAFLKCQRKFMSCVQFNDQVLMHSPIVQLCIKLK